MFEKLSQQLMVSVLGPIFLQVKANQTFFNDIDKAVLVNILCVFITVWVVLEIGFYYLVCHILSPKIQPINDPHHHHMDPLVTIKRVFDTIDSLEHMTIEHYLHKFFREAEFSEIHVNNFRSFLAWAMYAKHFNTLTAEEVDNVEAAKEEAYYRYKALHTLKPGFNPKVNHTAFNLEPIRYIHRPLFMYVAAGVAEVVSNFFLLRMCGFQCFEQDGCTYWYRQHGTTVGNAQNVPHHNNSTPVLILHGISTGWSFYSRLVSTMGQNRTIILLDLDAIKVKSMAFNMPTPQQFSDRVLRILKRHRIEKVSVIGHSFGTITAGWLVKQYPEVVSHLTLLDPVSLLLLTGDVAFNFLYRKPKTFVEWVIYLAASQEITISKMLYRDFWWYVNVVWLEDIPSHIGVVVGVAGNDEISHPKAVHEYVMNSRQIRIKERDRRAKARHNMHNNHAHSQTTNMLDSNTTTTTTYTATNDSSTDHPVAMIHGVYWEGYSHGQILLGGKEHNELIRLIHSSEKTSITV